MWFWPKLVLFYQLEHDIKDLRNQYDVARKISSFDLASTIYLHPRQPQLLQSHVSLKILKYESFSNHNRYTSKNYQDLPHPQSQSVREKDNFDRIHCNVCVYLYNLLGIFTWNYHRNLVLQRMYESQNITLSLAKNFVKLTI